MTGCVRAVCLASRLVNESTGGRHPSHSESDPVLPRLYCQQLALLQVRINGPTKVFTSERMADMAGNVVADRASLEYTRSVR